MAEGLSDDRVLDGRYRLLDPIGEGGMGTVYRATQLKLDREVAVKILLPEIGESAELRMRFEREAKTLAALSHPHIVSVTDYGLVDNVPYLVMELLEGVALDVVIKKHAPLPPQRLRPVFEQTLRALSYAHSRGITHRDLKPANVFLKRMSDVPVHVKLLDFGLAKFVEGDTTTRHEGPALTKQGTIVGTPAYMAPEQATGQGAEPRSDVYSAGIMLFEMLTGTRPFTGEPIDLIRHHLVTPLPSIESVCPGLRASPELTHFLEKATAKDLNARFANAKAMLVAFSALPSLVTGTPRPHAKAMGRPSHVPTAVGKVSSDAARAATLAVGTGSTEAQPATVKKTRRGVPVVALGAAATVLVGLTIAALFVVDALGGEEATATAAPPLVGEAGEAEAGDDAQSGSDRETETETDGESESETAVGVSDGEGEGESETGGEGDIADTLAGVMEDVASAVTGEEGEASSAEEGEAAGPDSLPPAVDPWTPPVPRTLASIRRNLRRGRKMHNAAERSLRRHAERNRDDPRAFLLLGHGYTTRGWRPDALERYQRAFAIDPNVRADPQMRQNLVRLSAHRGVGADAARMVRQVYGAEALPTVDELLATDGLEADERTRLTALRDSLQ